MWAGSVSEACKARCLFPRRSAKSAPSWRAMESEERQCGGHVPSCRQPFTSCRGQYAANGGAAAQRLSAPTSRGAQRRRMLSTPAATTRGRAVSPHRLDNARGANPHAGGRQQTCTDLRHCQDRDAERLQRAHFRRPSAGMTRNMLSPKHKLATPYGNGRFARDPCENHAT